MATSPPPTRFAVATSPIPASPVLSSRSDLRPSMYNPYDSYNKEALPSTVEANEAGAQGTQDEAAESSHSTGSREQSTFVTVYWGISSILGFREKYSLLLWEWFWYRQKLYKPNIFIHIYLSIIAGFMAVFQFIPAIRRRKMILHRLNGYMTLILLIPGTIAGGIVGRRAFGGSPSTQSAYYTATFLTVGAALTGYSKVRETRKHRKWMLRAVTYVSSVITTRVVEIIAREIISAAGGYYELWSCSELEFLQQNGQGVPNFAASYPICAASPARNSFSPVPPPFAPVLVKMRSYPASYGSAVRATFGMALWVSLVIHVLGIEVY
ncbi:hypothetical protein FRC00_009239, partial [Tulasnella sp. 408]